MVEHSLPVPSRPSPLDPYLHPFLRYIQVIDRGYSPSAQAGVVAGALGWPVPFVETLFIAARARGLVEASWERGNRSRWLVSARGLRWLSEHDGEDPVRGEIMAEVGGMLPISDLYLPPNSPEA